MDNKQALSTGMFYMWRCVIALAHADGKLAPAELAYLDKMLGNLLQYYDLTAEQKDAFAADLQNPQDIDMLFSRINEPEARDMLIGFAEELAWIDGELSADEEAVLKRLRLRNPEQFDRAALLEEIRADIARHRSEWDAERSALRKEARARNPYFYAADVILMKAGVDVLDH